ncbi:5'-methylthioadenosine/S-adenosylhomocysteine nucleosidase [Polyangium sorediatum]|uniref:5'-methylthioadenosine/S-adenosylhomocysteine nucleosidase n=1 Tax=Polyangium sorediatum TaxID=889274 RepID=A0ABT6NP19_9BACT|nr:5'-methylthioadenosine/S-adenosylhomocysteine nucleosidase [Polyangium sorediatum]MDI1430033.1 5'-methylthioadenosine/S-adenosylhomocysteine nucleosidase [Polyangium sorediatum]
MSDAAQGQEMWVQVAGTGSRKAPLPRTEELTAQAIGRALAHSGAGLVTCGWNGVDKAATMAFAGALQALGMPLSTRLKQIVPRPDEPSFFGGDVVYVEKGVPEWVESVRRAQAVVLIGGLGGTYKTYQTARNEQVPVFPLPSTGGDAKKAFDEIMADFQGLGLHRRVTRAQVAALDTPITTREEADDVAERLLDLITEELSGRRPVTATDRPKGPRQPKSTSKTKPERVDFLLVTALPEERDALLRRLPGFERVVPRKDDVHVYFRATLPVTDGSGSYRIVVLPLLGMGRVNAATATGEAIKRWRPRHVVLVGIAGGVAARSVSLGDLLISEQVVDYELQKLTEQGIEVRWSVHKASRRLYAAALNVLGDAWTKSLLVPRPGEGAPRIHLGPIASGDKVVAVERVLTEYRNVWPTLIGVEMEAAGVASACFAAARQPEFFMVRGVSDLADENKNTPRVDGFRSYACEVAAGYTVELLRSHPIPFLKSR